jgi:hypothetical protein
MKQKLRDINIYKEGKYHLQTTFCSTYLEKFFYKIVIREEIIEINNSLGKWVE